MAKAKMTTDINEIEGIRDDVTFLKNNIAALSKRIEAEGHVTASQLTEKAKENLHQLQDKAKENLAYFQDYSRDRLKNVEAEIKSHPAQSVAIAFGAGLALSYLLRRKK